MGGSPAAQEQAIIKGGDRRKHCGPGVIVVVEVEVGVVVVAVVVAVLVVAVVVVVVVVGICLYANIGICRGMPM